MYPNNIFYSSVLCYILSLWASSSRSEKIVVFNASCIMTTVKWVIWSSIKAFTSSSALGKYSDRSGVDVSPLATFGLGCRNFPCLRKSTFHPASVWEFIGLSNPSALTHLAAFSQHFPNQCFSQESANVSKAISYALHSYTIFWSVKILNLVICSSLWVTTLFTPLLQSIKSPVNNLIMSFRQSITFPASS